MAKETQSSSSIAMGVLEILREALKILPKNGKLMISIAFLVLIPSSLLFIAVELVLRPLLTELVFDLTILSTKDPGSPEYTKLLIEIKKDILLLILDYTIVAFVSFVVSFFSTVATIYASAVAYSGKHLTLKELLSRIRRIWKMPMITWLYVMLFDVVCTPLLIALILLMMHAKGSTGPLLVLIVVLNLLAFFSYVYLTVLFMLSQVISVVEEGCYGFKAFKKARALLEGKKLQGFVLALVFTLVAIPIAVIQGFITGNGIITVLIHLVFGVVLVNMTRLVQLYSYIAYTVFYHECKKRYEEKVEIDVESGYSSVPKTPLLVNVSLL